jgi:hypothetical protein
MPFITPRIQKIFFPVNLFGRENEWKIHKPEHRRVK